MIKIRPLEREDIEKIRNWRNANLDKFFDASYISKEQQRKWYEKYSDSGGTDLMFIIQADGEDIGTIALYNINPGDRTATLGRVLILEDYRGHGYAEEAVGLILDLAFKKMRLFKVKVEAHLDNIDAIAVYARNGFKTTTRPIILMEATNPDTDWKKPIKLSSYDDLSRSYESQHTNIKRK